MDTELLQKYISGEASDKEVAEVVRWIEADESNTKEYIKLRKAYDALLWIEESYNTENTIRKQKFKTYMLWIGRVASIVAIVLFSLYLKERKSSSVVSEVEMLTMSMPAGQCGELILADGSRVWLNSQSRLKFPSKFQKGTREVHLEGEAFFDVVSDQDNPFVVHTEKYSVKALGTAFNVCSFEGREKSITSLLSGSVEIELKESSQKYSLKPNEEFGIQENEVLLGPIISHSHFEWRDGVISFENETMDNLLSELGHYYGVEIVIKNKNVLHDKYSGRFKAKDGVDQALRVLKLRSNFNYEREDGYIVIK